MGFPTSHGRNTLKKISKKLIEFASRLEKTGWSPRLTRTVEEANTPTAEKSPYELFRAKRAYLSVTDIVSPAWCEVQYDYGLRQHRRRPLSQRPPTFTTAQGKEITVTTKVAEKNEQVLDKGRTVHKNLEREVHKKEVPVEVTSKEEAYALRLLDFLTRIKACTSTSVCREVPVWGIIHDHPIVGVIDELRLTFAKPVEESTNQGKQTKLDSFIISPKKTIADNTKSAKPPRILYIVDNKTRWNPHLPSNVDTLTSRLQVMLYWLLLSQALVPSPDIPTYSTFCARIGLDPKRPFSESFAAEMGAITAENDLSLHFFDAKCLEDMDFPYRETIKGFGLDVQGCVSKQLQLVYRRRGRVAKKLKRESTIDAKDAPPVVGAAVAWDTVIRNNGAGPTVGVNEADVKPVPPMDGTVDVEENISGARKRKRRKSRESSTSSSKSTETEKAASSGSGSDSDSSQGPTAAILGTKQFSYRERILNAHIIDVLAWWHGQRPPRGVSIEDVGRCNVCEYKNGCEWREQKALEILEKASSKQSVRRGDIRS